MIPLEPQHAAAAYEFLRVLPPMCRWKLPDAEAIEFHVVNRPDIHGEFIEFDPHIIKVSVANTGHIGTLLQTIAHEMCHLAQAIDGTRNRAQHNADWRRKAKRVCAVMGWDEKAF